MAYNQKLADRIRERIADIPNIEEKPMMGGLTFMLNDKMCIGIIKDEMMCRIDPDIYGDLIEKNGCRPMEFTGRPMKGYVLVDESAMRSQTDFDHWIDLFLEFNKKAKSSKKKKNKKVI
jgi:TfoX/Sxy family transcriptional regulator of competence genes